MRLLLTTLLLPFMYLSGAIAQPLLPSRIEEQFETTAVGAIPLGWIRNPSSAPSWGASSSEALTGVRSMYAQNVASAQTIRLTTPLIAQRNASAPWVAEISFYHKHSFEMTDVASPRYWDGGILEISTDGGTTWSELLASGGSFLENGYNGILQSGSSNELAGRQAFVGTSGTSFKFVKARTALVPANATLMVRWTLGTDGLNSPTPINPITGWYLDAVRVFPVIDMVGNLSPERSVVIAGQKARFTSTITNNGNFDTDISTTNLVLLNGQNTFSAVTPSRPDFSTSADPAFPVFAGVLANITMPSGATTTIAEFEVQTSNPPRPTGRLTPLIGGAPSGIPLGIFPLSNSPLTGSSGVSGTLAFADDGIGVGPDLCQPSASPATGLLLLVSPSTACEIAVQVQHAQDAGAKGVILLAAGATDILPRSVPLNPGTVIPVASLFPLFFENVLPSIGTTAQMIVSNDQVNVFGYVIGYGTVDSNNSNNLIFASIPVLRDDDRDDTADVNEQCPLDPAKVNRGVCGCGIADTDLNRNRVVDCLRNKDLRKQLATLETLLKRLALPASSRTQRSLRARVNTLGRDISAIVSPSRPGRLSLVRSGIRVNSLGSNVSQRVRGTLAAKRASALAFARARALLAIKTLRSSIK